MSRIEVPVRHTVLMRIYLPATTADLAAPDGLTARHGHVVTESLRIELDQDDPESAEHAALLLAAADSLTLLAGAEVTPRRVVVAADVEVAPPPLGPHAAVQAPAVPWRQVVSFHVDDVDDARTVQVLAAAATGDPDAADEAADLDLLWYDVSERNQLLDQDR